MVGLGPWGNNSVSWDRGQRCEWHHTPREEGAEVHEVGVAEVGEEAVAWAVHVVIDNANETRMLEHSEGFRV